MGESIVPAYPAALAAPERDGRAGTANGTGGMPAVVTRTQQTWGEQLVR
jgi:hypothetical protein